MGAKMRTIVLYRIDKIFQSDYDYDHNHHQEVVQSVFPSQTVTEEEYQALKLYCERNPQKGLKLVELEDFKDIIKSAKAFYLEQIELDAAYKKRAEKTAKRKSKAALERKYKKLEALRKELGASLLSHGKYEEPPSFQQS